jgi:hypothetical protein
MERMLFEGLKLAALIVAIVLVLLAPQSSTGLP